jgi:hypothetical protein
MKNVALKLSNKAAHAAATALISVSLLLVTTTAAHADEAQAKQILKSMSDYMAEQKAFTFEYDAILGVVTEGEQSLELASSGKVKLHRPNKVVATRSGGFVNLKTYFDGETMTILSKDDNLYTQMAIPGSIDNLISELTTKYDMPLPAGDLLATDSYDALMADVIDVKDLGSGVIDGVECDYFALRKADVDLQIWVAHGDEPYPCRFVITSKDVVGQPSYSVQLRDWKAHKTLESKDFEFKNKTDAGEVELQELRNTVLPPNFKAGDSQ